MELGGSSYVSGGQFQGKALENNLNLDDFSQQLSGGHIEEEEQAEKQDEEEGTLCLWMSNEDPKTIEPGISNPNIVVSMQMHSTLGEVLTEHVFKYKFVAGI